MLTRLFAGLALAATLSIAAVAPAKASDLIDPADFTLKYAFGGALPHAARQSFMTGSLEADRSILPKLGNSSSLPFADSAKTVFDARPQIMIGGSMEVGRIGNNPLMFDGMVSAGTFVAADDPRPLLGMAGFRLVF